MRTKKINDKITFWEVNPHDSHKSFYNKAYAATIDLNGKSMYILYSYNTPIIAVWFDNNAPSGERNHMVLWDGWSATTGRHIKAFCSLNKEEFLHEKSLHYCDDLATFLYTFGGFKQADIETLTRFYHPCKVSQNLWLNPYI